MNTDQNYGAAQSGANDVEQTVNRSSLYSINIEVDLATQFTVLHWALTELKDKLYEDCADSLAAHDLLQYQDHVSSISSLNEMLDHLVLGLHKKYEQLLDLHEGNDPIEGQQKLTEARKCERQKLAKRFGWVS